MKRINLHISEELRHLCLSICAADGYDHSMHRVAHLIMDGADMVADPVVQPHEIASLRSLLERDYHLIKDGKGPSLAVYIGIADPVRMRLALARFGVHPKARGLRMFLLIGVARWKPTVPIDIWPVGPLGSLIVEVREQFALNRPDRVIRAETQ